MEGCVCDAGVCVCVMEVCACVCYGEVCVFVMEMCVRWKCACVMEVCVCVCDGGGCGAGRAGGVSGSQLLLWGEGTIWGPQARLPLCFLTASEAQEELAHS